MFRGGMEDRPEWLAEGASTDFEDGAATSPGGCGSQKGPHGLCHATLLANDLASVALRARECHDCCAPHFTLTHIYPIGFVHEASGNEFDKWLHYCSVP